MSQQKKYFLTFASLNILNEVNHRIYRNRIHALGVVLLNSFYLVKSVFSDSEKATPFLISKLQIFTNAKHSRNFGAGEAQYPATNAGHTKRGKHTTGIRYRLFFRRIYGIFRGTSAEVLPDHHAQKRDQHYFRAHQEDRLLRFRRHLPGRLPLADLRLHGTEDLRTHLHFNPKNSLPKTMQAGIFL